MCLILRILRSDSSIEIMSLNRLDVRQSVMEIHDMQGHGDSHRHIGAFLEHAHGSLWRRLTPVDVVH